VSGFPPFDTPVPDGGYRWWYVDAISQCGRHALTLISSIGSVFSPYYFRARSKGIAAADAHCSFNVALYGRPHGWAMTERAARWVERSRDRLRIGPSAVALERSGAGRHRLCFQLQEVTCPLPRPLRGVIAVDFDPPVGAPLALDAGGRHHWWPLAPQARVQVRLAQPALAWTGTAYVDSNWGDEPLEAAFRRWDWARLHDADGNAVIHYDLAPRQGPPRPIGLALSGPQITRLDATPPLHALARTAIWRMPRNARGDGTPCIVRTLEDTPFYARTQIRSTDGDRTLDGVHESVELDRFVHPATQLMLPFRMPRRR
jgi:carotenoid 1,2-hydratase